MILKNINVAKGLCNGTKCIMRALDGTPSNPRLTIETMTGAFYTITTADGYTSRSERPLKLVVDLAFAMTIHKSQGQTLGKVIVDFNNKKTDIQKFYVVMSRVKELSDMRRTAWRQGVSSMQYVSNFKKRSFPLLAAADFIPRSDGCPSSYNTGVLQRTTATVHATGTAPPTAATSTTQRRPRSPRQSHHERKRSRSPNATPPTATAGAALPHTTSRVTESPPRSPRQSYRKRSGAPSESPSHPS